MFAARDQRDGLAAVQVVMRILRIEADRFRVLLCCNRKGKSAQNNSRDDEFHASKYISANLAITFAHGGCREDHSAGAKARRFFGCCFGTTQATPATKTCRRGPRESRALLQSLGFGEQHKAVAEGSIQALLSGQRSGGCLFLRLIERLLIRDARPILRLQFLAYLLDLAEHAQQVSAQNLAAILGGVAAF